MSDSNREFGLSYPLVCQSNKLHYSLGGRGGVRTLVSPYDDPLFSKQVPLATQSLFRFKIYCTSLDLRIGSTMALAKAVLPSGVSKCMEIIAHFLLLIYHSRIPKNIPVMILRLIFISVINLFNIVFISYVYKHYTFSLVLPRGLEPPTRRF